MPDVTVTYTGNVVYETSESGSGLIETAGKFCKHNFELVYARPDTSGEPLLPEEYQRVKYLEFTPNVGIIVTIPQDNRYASDGIRKEWVLFSADCASTKNNPGNDQYSCIFGYRASYTNYKDFLLGFNSTSDTIFNYFYSSDYGCKIEDGKSYESGTRMNIHTVLYCPRTTALIGAYLDDVEETSHYIEASNCFQGKFYSLKETDVPTGVTVAWFVPCYRISDDVVGVYDHIAHAFYHETRHYGSNYDISPGPNVY